MVLMTMAIAAMLAQAPAQPPVDVPVLKAGLGECSADFTVTGADGKPVYLATIHVRLRYGFMSLKRMDLEVGTNSDGKARVEGLPARARPLNYEIVKDSTRRIVTQDLSTVCNGSYSVALTPGEAASQ
ncbi:MAG: hypothetical protein AB7K63_08065 [Vicinamibacterales bacterium]